MDKISLFGMVIGALGCASSLMLKNYIAAVLWLVIIMQDLRIQRLEKNEK